jgi:anaerobic C4-dicarboxylate transporter
LGEWIKEFFKNGDNINEIAYVVIGILITLFSTAILNLIKWLYKKTKKLDIDIDISARVKKMKVKRTYKKTIKQIERMEISMPAHFLFLKSPEKNPELKKFIG